ncbi:MAG: hypothetical protein ACK4SY_06870 [Pyrobaculum sp.]
MRCSLRAWGGTGGDFNSVIFYGWNGGYHITFHEGGRFVEVKTLRYDGTWVSLAKVPYTFGSGWYTAEVWLYYEDNKVYIRVAVNGTTVAEAVDNTPYQKILHGIGSSYFRSISGGATNFHALDNLYVEPYHPGLYNTAPGSATAIDWRLMSGRRWVWRFSDVSRSNALFRFVPQGSRVDGGVYLATSTGFNVSAPGVATYVEVPYVVPQLAGKFAGLMPAAWVFQGDSGQGKVGWGRAYISSIHTVIPHVGVIDAMVYIPQNLTVYDTRIYISGGRFWDWERPYAIRIGRIDGVGTMDTVYISMMGNLHWSTVKVPVGRWFRLTVVYNETHLAVYVDGTRIAMSQKPFFGPYYDWWRPGVGYMPSDTNLPTLYYKYVAVYTGRVDMGERLPDLGGLRYVYFLDATQSPPGFYTEAGAVWLLSRYFVLPRFEVAGGVFTACGSQIAKLSLNGSFVVPSSGDAVCQINAACANNVCRLAGYFPPGFYNFSVAAGIYRFEGILVANGTSNVYLGQTVLGYVQWPAGNVLTVSYKPPPGLGYTPPPTPNVGVTVHTASSPLTVTIGTYAYIPPGGVAFTPPQLGPFEVGIGALVIALATAVGTIKANRDVDEGILVGGITFAVVSTALSFVFNQDPSQAWNNSYGFVALGFAAALYAAVKIKTSGGRYGF